MVVNHRLSDAKSMPPGGAEDWIADTLLKPFTDLTVKAVLPAWPFCPPVGFLPATGNDFGAGLFKPSLEAGLLELRLFLLSFDCSSATCDCNAAICFGWLSSIDRK